MIWVHVQQVALKDKSNAFSSTKKSKEKNSLYFISGPMVFILQLHHFFQNQKSHVLVQLAMVRSTQSAKKVMLTCSLECDRMRNY